MWTMGIGSASIALGQAIWIIEKFLNRVRESGGRINIAKSELMRTEVKYFGFVVGKHGIKMDPKYQQALVDFLSLQSPKAPARFLGMVGYYKHFLNTLAEDSTQLHQLDIEMFTEISE